MENLIRSSFKTTDFLIQVNLSKRPMGVKELINETGFLRGTVNTSLMRLLDEGLVSRDSINGIFCYSNKKKYQISDKEFEIFSNLFKNYNYVVTSNAIRLIYVVMNEGEVVLADLINNRGWKNNSTYENARKLKEVGILREEQGAFFLTNALFDKVPISFATLNANFYRGSGDFDDVFELIEDNSCTVIGLQDVVIEKLDKIGLLDKILEKFVIIYPDSYNYSKHRKFMIAITLVKKSEFQDYTPHFFSESFSLRYTYGDIKLKSNNTFRFFNLYIPQSINISKERKKEIKVFWEELLLEVKECRLVKTNLVLLGDLNSGNHVSFENQHYFNRLDDLLIDSSVKYDMDYNTLKIENSKGDPTYKNLDYIFVNTKVYFSFNVELMVEDFIESSDHRMLKMILS